MRRHRPQDPNRCRCGAGIGEHHKMSCYDPRRDWQGRFNAPFTMPEFWASCGPTAEECLGDRPNSSTSGECNS